MKVLVCGGRDYNRKCELYFILDKYHEEHNFTQLIHGKARGADSLAGQWAQDKKIPVLAFPADWQHYGRDAGPIRNAKMIEIGKPELVIAFPGGKGTNNMVTQARNALIRVIMV